MAKFNGDRLTEIRVVATSAGVVYTNPANLKTFIKLIIVHNVDGASARDITLNNVPNTQAAGVGTAATANQFYKKSLAADATDFIELKEPGMVLKEDNETIQALAGTVDTITFQMFGVTEDIS